MDRTFAKNLKRVMSERRVTATQLAKATQIPKSTISEWLSGRDPKLGPGVLKVARHLQVTLDFLISGDMPATSLVDALLGSSEPGYVTVHRGQYRVTIERKDDEAGGDGDA